MHWRRKWQPTPGFLPGESQGWGSLVGCCLWGHTVSDTTEATWQQQEHMLFNMLSRLVITLLPRSKCLFISWLQSPSAVFWGPPKIKPVTVSIVSPSIFHEVMGPNAMVLVFWMLSFKPTFSLSSFTFTKRLFMSSFSAIVFNYW